MNAHDLPGGPGSDSPPPTPPMTRGQKLRMVVKVVELRLRFVALMTATGLVFAYWDTLWNYYDKWTRPPSAVASAGPGIEFYCPMHPKVIRDDQSGCPICGMPLSKRAKGEHEELPEGVTARVQLSPNRIAQGGIRTAQVSYEPIAEELTTVGYVTVDERRQARIASKVRGMSRVEELFVNFTGTKVEAGKPLAELYSPELYQAIQELLLAGRSASETDAPRPRSSVGQSLLGDSKERLRLSREKLLLWGLTGEQIDRILADGTSNFRVPILSPIDGVVIRKNVVEGQYVSEGDDLFEIADLDHVWIQAQVFEDRLGLVRVGQSVEATVQTFPGEVFEGEVAFIDPILNPETRTVDVRVDLPNPDGRLRPGMFATVTLRTPVADTPMFASRRPPEREPGAPVRPASLTVEQQEVCLVTGADLGSMGGPLPVEVDGTKLWICCAGCETPLQNEPGRFLARLEGPPSGQVLSIPETSVIDTGARKIVYVEVEPGVFEGRVVILGPPSAGRYPVLEGLEPGENVAAAGSFLIDAETRLNPAAGSIYFGGTGTK